MGTLANGSACVPALTGLVVADLTRYLDAIVTAMLLAGALGVGVAMFIWARKWHRRTADAATTEEHVDSYQHMLDAGLIDPQEYAHIQARLQRPPDTPAAPRVAPPVEPPLERNP